MLPVYGGQPIGRQLRELERGVDVVVATPGRALDHLSRGQPAASTRLRTVVLDEADEMLDMGFADDLEAILAAAPARPARPCCSRPPCPPTSTGSPAGRTCATPSGSPSRRQTPAPGRSPLVRQTAYVVAPADKPAALGRVLDVEAPGAALVFCRTREEVDALTQTLTGAATGPSRCTAG